MSPYPPRPVFVRCVSAYAARAALLLLGGLHAGISVCATPDKPAPGEAAFFESKVRPILEEHCFDCHGPDKQKNKLRLDTPLGILKGGESGEPLLLAGNSAESYLLKRVRSTNSKEQMPPKGPRLAPAEQDVLQAWIDAGARIPGADAAAHELRIRTEHWSFQPVRSPGVPRLEDPFVRGPVDAFVLAALRAKGLKPSAPADKQTLLRRVHLVMHGMPPSVEEAAAFENDTRPDAYERLVERVLASPRYGERWARHWMDIARYADTDGFERNVERTTAYPYRDYLVEAFNSDKPYDRFVREQIAGDAYHLDAATGFLVAGPYDSVKSPDENLRLMQRQDELADMVNTTGTAFLGLTMGCARCHNHKFDPIPQKDYYAVQAVFAGVLPAERPLRERQNAQSAASLAALQAKQAELQKELDALQRKASQPAASGLAAAQTPAKPVGGLRAPVDPALNEETFEPLEASAVRFTILATNSGEPCLDEIEIFDEAGRNVALAKNGAKASASGSLAGYAIHKLEHIHDGRFGNSHSWISDARGAGWVQIDLGTPARIARVVWGRDREGRFKDRVPVRYEIEAVTGVGQRKILASSKDRQAEGEALQTDAAGALKRLSPEDAARAGELQSELSAIKGRVAEAENRAWVGRFSPNPPRTHRLYRGEPTQKREEVAPGALSVIGDLGLDVDEPEQARRVRFAEWIVDPKNPLTARVLVNRLWHYIFGNGIVDTPSDLGVNGGAPTHPELLDWLAGEFVRSGWSVKHMQRLILLSSTFRQDSRPNPQAATLDADARFLWRFPPRRLEAEAIRDSLLAASGALDLHMGGPGFALFDVQRENVRHYFPKEDFTRAEFRRMVYMFRVRAAQDGVFGAFDCPDGGSVTARRSRSNTPLQALNLFNSKFAVGQAQFLAERVEREAGPGVDAQVRKAFRLVFLREPDAFELETAGAMVREHGLHSLARALFNTSEFLFVF